MKHNSNTIDTVDFIESNLFKNITISGAKKIRMSELSLSANGNEIWLIKKYIAAGIVIYKNLTGIFLKNRIIIA